MTRRYAEVAMASLPVDTATLTDEQLIGALRAGDDAAFSVLLERYHENMVQLARSFVGDPGLADAVVRDALLDVLGRLDSVDGRTRLGVWLYGVVVGLGR